MSKSAYSFLIKNKNNSPLLALIYDQWKKGESLEINELAHKAYLSKSSITRYFQTAGFDGFKEFKYILQNENISSVAPETSFNDYAFEEEIMIQPILVTSKLNGLEVYNQAISWLENAGCNYILGVGGNLSVCFEFRVRLERLGFQTSYFSDVHNMFVSLTRAKASDLLWVFSYSGETPEILHLTKEAKNHDLKIIAITRSGNNSLSQLADLCFQIDDSENLVRLLAFKSRIAMTYVIYKLIAMVIEQKSEFYHQRLTANIY
ncbi:RpiR family transcriptional regulator [Entomoplasma freundtii]|uniref:RpiR family transcriptional regulator n=1 Tax=Entomoplasma freundtii TaxID=74700 RepID=A0A2K8NU53_9MOLU|nr:MurR/RpiR family transcriptional regulator [Entomoplasma freundtii]ATZ16291.1 RpiR family transcriptional regulator [Entomoplasma freundtii]TDY56807.1 RpiR family transcriptional regulator [Entomoplasma freundtii]